MHNRIRNIRRFDGAPYQLKAVARTEPDIARDIFLQPGRIIGLKRADAQGDKFQAVFVVEKVAQRFAPHFAGAIHRTRLRQLVRAKRLAFFAIHAAPDGLHRGRENHPFHAALTRGFQHIMDADKVVGQQLFKRRFVRSRGQMNHGLTTVHRGFQNFNIL